MIIIVLVIVGLLFVGRSLPFVDVEWVIASIIALLFNSVILKNFDFTPSVGLIRNLPPRVLSIIIVVVIVRSASPKFCSRDRESLFGVIVIPSPLLFHAWWVEPIVDVVVVHFCQ